MSLGPVHDGRPRSQKFPGGRVVAGCFIVLTVSSGLGFYGLAVYLNAFSRERDWPVASISLATTIYFVVGGVTGLYVARVIARRDVRIPIVGGAIAGCVSLALLGQVQEKWQLYVVYAVFALGFSGAGLIPVTTVITRWYHVRRSVALSVASTGLSAGGILLTPLSKRLIDDRGLSSATPILAAIWLVGILPFALWLVRPDPAKLGWRPDGERADADTIAAVPTGVPYADALRTRFFLTATIAYVLVLGSQVGAIQQVVKLVEDRTDSSTAALATTALASTSVVFRLLGGRIVSRAPIVGMICVLAVAQGVSLVAIAFASSKLTLFPSIVLFGATVGNLLMLQPLMIAERFGIVDYARIYSRSSFFTMFGSAGGPLLLGWLYDNVAGEFRTTYLVAAGGSIAGALVLASGGPAVLPDGDDVPAAQAAVAQP